MDKLKGTDTVRLIQLIKDGENSSDAFAELMSRYEPLIEARVSAFFDSAAIADEARQEASIALHNAAISYDLGKSDVVTFGLYAGICISNKLKTFYKTKMKESELFDRFSEAERIACSANLESKIAANDLCSRVMHAAKQVLSDFEFSVFKLSFEQYSTKDIAAILGKTPKSVDNAKNRISRRLRENDDIRFILTDV